MNEAVPAYDGDRAILTPVPVIEPLRSILKELREAEGNPQTGWILKGVRGGPLSLDYLAREHIIPTLRTKGIP